MELRCEKRFPVRLPSVVIGSPHGESSGMIVSLSKQGCLIKTDSSVNPEM